MPGARVDPAEDDAVLQDGRRPLGRPAGDPPVQSPAEEQVGEVAEEEEPDEGEEKGEERIKGDLADEDRIARLHVERGG